MATTRKTDDKTIVVVLLMSVLADFMRMTAVVTCFDRGPFGPAAGPRRLDRMGVDVASAPRS